MKKVDDDTFERKCRKCQGTGVYEEADFPYITKYRCDWCNETGVIRYSISKEIKSVEGSIKHHEDRIRCAKEYLDKLKSL